MLGKGDGTIGAPTFSAKPSTNENCERVTNVAAADLNGDSKLDLLAPVAVSPTCINFGSSFVNAYLGNGDGTFQPAQQFNLATVPSWLTLGDFSEKTLADFAVSNASVNDVSVFLNGTAGVTLSLMLAGSGGGAVTSQSYILDCSSSCSGQFAPGTMVTLTAGPNAASDFTGWSGACSGTGTCSITMTSNESVTATFGALPPPDFSIAPASASLTGQRRGQVTDVLTLAPLSGRSFTSVIQLACTVTGSTPLATCTLSSTAVTPGANSATSTLTVTAPGLTAKLVPSTQKQRSAPLHALLVPMQGLVLLGFCVALSKMKQRPRQIWLLCSLFLCHIVLQAGCGGGSSTPPPAPLNYTVTVTATSGAIQHTTQVTVTVP